MRAIFKFVIAVGLLGIAAFAIYMVRQDMNPLDLDDIKKAATSSKAKLDKIPKVLDGTVDNLDQSVIYKRKDAKGNWYYTNEPPKEGEESETLIYRSDTNVLPPLPDDNKSPKNR